MDYLYNKKYLIIWSQNFKEELIKILNYLRLNLNQPVTSKKLYQKIITSLNFLNEFPNIYPKLDFPQSDKNIRKIVINNYIILYEVRDETRSSFYTTYISWKSKLFKSIIIFNIN